MRAYIDSSVLLRYVLDESEILKEFSQVQHFISSELIRLECLRVIDRLRNLGQLSDEGLSQRREWILKLFKRFELIRLNDRILDRASQPFPSPCGSLDAIHLTSALLWQETRGESLCLMTHDRQLGRAARSMGLEVFGDS